MSDQFLAEIRVFPFNFAPVGWAMCNGQLLPISQYAALFSLIGTYYGGNGTSNFQLPNFQGYVPVGQGQGPGLSLYTVGETGGTATVTILGTENSSHTHSLNASDVDATSATPSNNNFLRGHWSVPPAGGAVEAYSSAAPGVNMNPLAVGLAGGNQPHNNMMPYLGLNFCIALQGVFPPRS